MSQIKGHRIAGQQAAHQVGESGPARPKKKVRITSYNVCYTKLLRGYAVTFNLRHSRSGHLFQNRYKSLVCEEEPYLLELVRYIHLNPLRAGIVASMDELELYPWSGHGVLMA